LLNDWVIREPVSNPSKRMPLQYHEAEQVVLPSRP